MWKQSIYSANIGNDNVILYHATNEEASKSILRTQSFRLPTPLYAIQHGLKLGAAVYFGTDPKYCVREAGNTEGNHNRNIVVLKVGAKDFFLFALFFEGLPGDDKI